MTVRHLVDDGAFATLLDRPGLPALLEDFHLMLFALRREGEPAGMVRGWATVRVGETDLGTVLSTPSPDARDAALLAMTALDECVIWDDDPDLAVDSEVDVDGEPYDSFAVARCADLASTAGLVVACITLGSGIQPGVRDVTRDTTSTPVCFVTSLDHRPAVARHRIHVETDDERGFFKLAAVAFPGICFADGVTFRKFDGSFDALKEPVLRHLAALSDRFTDTYRLAQGNLSDVAARLNVDMSREGANRGSEKVMRERDATFHGVVYRCEMHTKIERHRNRIHFHEGDEHTDGRVVIGHFVRHFTT